MSIQLAIATADMRELRQPRERGVDDGRSQEDIDRTIAQGQRWLRLLNVTDATISLIRKSNGHVAFGSTRIPLLVTKADGTKFVLKAYDTYNAKTEAAVLIALQNSLAPKIVRMLEEGLAEEYIDPDVFRSILHQSETDLSLSIKCLARGYAILAKHEVVFGHSHSYDEFHINHSGRLVITDFGTSRFFYKPKEWSTFDGYMKIVHKYGLDELARSELPAFRNNTSFQVIANSLIQITNDPGKLINMFLGVRQGLKEVVALYEINNNYKDGWSFGEAQTNDFMQYYVSCFI